MDSHPDEPADIDALKAALATARAKASDDQALIAHLKLQIEKLRRELYGPRSERTSRILDQMEDRGIVGPADGSRFREVLVTPDGWGGEIGPDEDGE